MSSSARLIVRPTISLRSSSNAVIPKTPTRKNESRIRHLGAHSSLSMTYSKAETHDSSQAGYYRMSSDISTMFSIREKIEHLVELSIQVVLDNDTTPEIEAEFEPALRALEHSYPPFHKQGVHYFTTYCSMQESAKTNQILSSAGVRMPLQAFTQDWKALCGIIDKYTNLNPPPHAKEINSKFKAVRASLDTIRKTNERRKHPTPGITPCITNILALGKSISKNIVDLFSQNFTEFGSNLFDSLRTDVKSFLKVINEAFSNEFVQSGVMLCDLYRIRSNIFTDCNEIIESLKAAFVFPKQMSEIHILKNTTEGELKRIIEKLSVPFIIIKPNAEAISELTPPEEDSADNYQEEVDANNFVERDEIIPQALPKQDYLAACNRIDEFTTNVFDIIDYEIDYSKDTWDNLNEIKHIITNYKNEIDSQRVQIKALNHEIEQLRESNDDNEILFIKKSEALTKANDINTARLEKTEIDNAKLVAECEVQKKEIENLQFEYSNLRSKGDAVAFRNALVDVGKSLDSNAKIELLPQDDLIQAVKSIVLIEVNKKCENCPILEGRINNVQNQLRKIMDKLKDIHPELPDYQKEEQPPAPDKTGNKKLQKKDGPRLLADNFSQSRVSVDVITDKTKANSDEVTSRSIKSTSCLPAVDIRDAKQSHSLSLSRYLPSLGEDSQSSPKSIFSISETESIQESTGVPILQVADDEDMMNTQSSFTTSPSRESLIASKTDIQSINELPSVNEAQGNQQNPLKISNDDLSNNNEVENRSSVSEIGPLMQLMNMTNSPKIISTTLEDTVKYVEILCENHENDYKVLLEQVNISKMPVVEAILMVDDSYDKERLMEKLPSSLRQILHNCMRTFLGKMDKLTQSFEKKEGRYLTTLFQIGEKLGRMANSQSIEFNSKAETSAERNRIIEYISTNFKTLKGTLYRLEEELITERKLSHKLQIEKEDLRDAYCEIFKLRPHTENGLKECRLKMNEIYSNHDHEIQQLNITIETLKSNATAIEERIIGMSQEYEGNLYEKLEKLQDKSEKLFTQHKDMENEITKLKDALLNIAAILDNRNDMNDDESIQYIYDFCAKHRGGVRVIDVPKLDLLLSHLDCDKNAPLEDIIEKLSTRDLPKE
ncbi:hypothetical protein TRFO_07441 [Tritrichomonas foetus]|uniref:Uncharacterized protein n=1 Tax=Tritrichomonas foetus TaxID=1144522 RepID=A0A1J4JWF6_9EUKA|nr:hypothetical protein TRFO_07441 [Tritrichomonas foetus]|eukprot:OHT01860.1 hypothetical protein TRFO_07441 [Tritrichomonas foetus]